MLLAAAGYLQPSAEVVVPKSSSLKVVAIVFCTCLLAIPSFATPITTIFDVNYNNSYNYSDAPLPVPFDSTLSFAFALSTYKDYTYPDGSATYRLFGEIINSITVTTDDYAMMPSPYIEWTSDQQGNVYIWRDNSTNTYKFVVSNSLSYWNPYDPYRWHYFKSASVESDFVNVDGYDPFENPLRFIGDLRLNETAFSTTIIQNRWRRINSRPDIYEGGLLRGSAIIASSTTPVPEPNSILLFAVGILLFIFLKRANP